MTQFITPTLGGVDIPMPTTQSSNEYSVGTTLYTPTGKPRTQRHFTGQIVSMTWQKLSDADRDTLKDQLDTVGFNTVPLRLTDGTTVLQVIPNSFEAYSEEKFEHLIADKVRWNTSMTWREVPQ